jgi:hypothetical protein
MVLGPSSVFAGLALAWLSLQLPPALREAPPLALGGSLATNLVLGFAGAVQCGLVRRPAAATRRTAVKERCRPEGLEPTARYLVDIDSYRPPLPRRRCVLAGAEHLARRVIQIHRAVRRNARAPDFVGLGSYLLHMGEGEAAWPAPDFDRHVAGLMRDEAHVLKQHRVAREEQKSLDKKKGGPQ